MIWRTLVVVFGTAVVAAATHANIVHAGGYGSDAAPLALAVAALLAVGMGFVGLLWSERRWFGAALLGLCLMSGEAYWLLSNAEREIAAREDLAAPATEALAKRQAAETRLADAKQGKAAADSAAVSEAAKPGCRSNCAKLLSDAQTTANAELQAARQALAALPMAKSPTPLPARLGVAPWAWDLIMVCLRSIAVMGGSLGIGLALHPRRAVVTIVEAPKVAPLPEQKRDLAPGRPAGREHVAAFLKTSLRPDPKGAASLRELHAAYRSWCCATSVAPLAPAELGGELRSIVDAIGLECQQAGRDVVIHGASLAGNG